MKLSDRSHIPEPDDPCDDDLVAAVALSAPRHRAPAHCLREIRTAIAADTGVPQFLPAAAKPPGVNGHTHIAKRRPSWIGYGIAAALAVFGGWQTVRIHQLEKENTSLKTTTADKTQSGADPAGENGTPGGINPGAPGTCTAHRAAHSILRPANVDAIVVPDPAELKRQIAELKRLNDSRFQPAPGLARTVVMELQKPGSSPGTSLRTPTLSAEVADIIAAGMDKTKPAGTKSPLTLSGNDRQRPGDEIVISEGLPNLFGMSLQPDATLLHQDFPAADWQSWEGLHLLKDGSFYDELNNILWKPIPGEGRRYSGRVPEDPVILEEQAAPRDAAAPSNPAALNAPATPGEPLVWSIYDESRGEGRLVISDLPPPPAGQAYQLWFEEARGTAPVSAGLLPSLENGAGQVWFDLAPGLTPVGYRLTLEPSGGSPSPLGPVILNGP